MSISEIPTILNCTTCGKNFGVSKMIEEDIVLIIQAHKKNHDNIIYLVPPGTPRILQDGEV